MTSSSKWCIIDLTTRPFTKLARFSVWFEWIPFHQNDPSPIIKIENRGTLKQQQANVSTPSSNSNEWDNGVSNNNKKSLNASHDETE
jgi:hypothetical protein